MNFIGIWRLMQDTSAWVRHRQFIICDDEVAHPEAGIRFFANCHGVCFRKIDGTEVVYAPNPLFWLLLHWPACKIRKHLKI